jgi:hypothetical protein
VVDKKLSIEQTAMLIAEKTRARDFGFGATLPQCTGQQSASGVLWHACEANKLAERYLTYRILFTPIGKYLFTVSYYSPKSEGEEGFQEDLRSFIDSIQISPFKNSDKNGDSHRE